MHAQSLAVCSSLSRNETLHIIPPSVLTCPLILLLFWSWLCSHFKERLFHSRVPDILIFWLLDSYQSASKVFPELWWRISKSNDVDVTDGAGLPIICLASTLCPRWDLLWSNHPLSKKPLFTAKMGDFSPYRLLWHNTVSWVFYEQKCFSQSSGGWGIQNHKVQADPIDV